MVTFNGMRPLDAPGGSASRAVQVRVLLNAWVVFRARSWHEKSRGGVRLALQVRCPGLGGSSGPPAKHWAIAIHRVAVSPTTWSWVSAMLRPWVTT